MTIIIILLLFFSTHADILLQNCQFSSSLRHTQTTIIKSKRSIGSIVRERERERHSMILMHSIDVVHSNKYKNLTSKKGCESFNFYFYCRTITERRIPWKGKFMLQVNIFFMCKIAEWKMKKRVVIFEIFFKSIYLSLWKTTIFREIIAVISIKLFSLHSVDIYLMNFFHINKNSTRYAEAR